MKRTLYDPKDNPVTLSGGKRQVARTARRLLAEGYTEKPKGTKGK